MIFQLKDTKNPNNNIIMSKNKFVGLMIDSDTDSESDMPIQPIKIVVPKIIQVVIPEVKESEKTEELEELKEIDLPKKNEWRSVDKRGIKGSYTRRIIKEKVEFVQEPSIDYGDGLYLGNQWDVYCRKKSSQTWETKDFNNVYQINNISTFCKFFNNFTNLDKLTYDFFVFKDKIIPKWEDNANRNGGICSILISCNEKKNKLDVISEIMMSICLLAVNGNLIKDNHRINGIVYNLRKPSTVLIKIWYDDHNFDMKNQIPLALFEYFEEKISSGFKNESVSKIITIRFEKINPTK